MSPVSNCVLVTTADVSVDVQGSEGILPWLPHHRQEYSCALWNGLSLVILDSQTTLAFTFGKLTATQYVDHILSVVVLPFLSQLHELNIQHDIIQLRTTRVFYKLSSSLLYTSFKNFVVWTLWYRTHLRCFEKAIATISQCWQIKSSSWRQFAAKFCRTPSINFISLCHTEWQFASRPEVDQHLIYFLTL